MQPPKRVEVNNYPPFEILKDNLRTNPYCLLPDLKHMTTTIHYLEKGTGINWHDEWQLDVWCNLLFKPQMASTVGWRVYVH